MSTKKMISIWFFIGCLLAVYGALVLAAGVGDVQPPQGHEVAMPQLHMQIWWGAGMLIMGLAYAIRFRPRPERRDGGVAR